MCCVFNHQVKFSVFLQYLRALGWGYGFWIFFFYFIQNIAFIGQNLWLSDWTNDSVEYYNKTYPSWLRDTRVGVFGALGVVQGNTFCTIFTFIQFSFKDKVKHVCLFSDTALNTVKILKH